MAANGAPPVESYTKDAAYLIVHETDATEEWKRVHYLLPDGSRRAPVLHMAFDTPELRAAVGDALAGGRVSIGRPGF